MFLFAIVHSNNNFINWCSWQLDIIKTEPIEHYALTSDPQTWRQLFRSSLIFWSPICSHCTLLFHFSSRFLPSPNGFYQNLPHLCYYLVSIPRLNANLVSLMTSKNDSLCFRIPNSILKVIPLDVNDHFIMLHENREMQPLLGGHFLHYDMNSSTQRQKDAYYMPWQAFINLKERFTSCCTIWMKSCKMESNILNELLGSCLSYFMQ